MSKSLAILGRQPAIGLAELESLYGAESLHPVPGGVILDMPTNDIDFKRLGGSMKLAKLLTILDYTDWGKIEDYLAVEIPKHTQNLSEGKFTLGLSAYGFNSNPRRINATALYLKKVIKATGQGVRIVPNKSLELSSAQVLHNKLFTSHNWELLLLKDGNKTYLAQTTNVQDIDAYAARDQARPKRDAKVGMLPPKLAQTLINLANPAPETTVLDPFCGTGVLLQEAILMGYKAYGTDLEPRMIEYSQKNLQWLNETHHTSANPVLDVGDATNYKWNEPFETVACETYLGRAFTTHPDQQTLRKVMQDVDTIHEKFLKNLANQTKSGQLICIAVPAWSVGQQFKHLKTLDSLGNLGYTRVSFAHADNQDLIYHRDGQIVGRELVVLKRK